MKEKLRLGTAYHCNRILVCVVWCVQLWAQGIRECRKLETGLRIDYEEQLGTNLHKT